MSGILSAVGILPLILLFAGAESGHAQAAEMPPRGISVSGTAEVQAAPDIAHVTLGARTRANRASQAATENAAILRRMIEAIRGLQVPEEDIQTVQYMLQPVFEYPREAPGGPRLVGYEATNRVRVTLRDLTKVGQVVDAGVSAGANDVQEVSFSVRDESALREQALRQAAQQAKSKASALAEALGVRLGPLISASESVGPIIVQRFAAAEAAAAPETPIMPGQIQVRATVNLWYIQYEAPGP